jgi:hypothetical protein
VGRAWDRASRCGREPLEQITEGRRSKRRPFRQSTQRIALLAAAQLQHEIAKRSQFGFGDRITSFRQIEANRRNARLSAGPRTEEGKSKSRRNALRHGLTAETVIDALEDAADYAAFELAVTSDYDARTAVERELVLRLASLLWRLRRATAIESDLFKIQAQHLLQFRSKREAQGHQTSVSDPFQFVIVAGSEEDHKDERTSGPSHWVASNSDAAVQANGLTHSFVRLSNLPTYPLDRLSRYEATLWRQACQVLFSLRCLKVR